jgi:hypothetical protein
VELEALLFQLAFEVCMEEEGHYSRWMSELDFQILHRAILFPVWFS